MDIEKLAKGTQENKKKWFVCIKLMLITVISVNYLPFILNYDVAK